MWLILRLAFRGGASVQASPAQPDVFPSSLEAASRQREEVSSAYINPGKWVKNDHRHASRLVCVVVVSYQEYSKNSLTDTCRRVS